LVNAENGETERISQIFLAEGKDRTPVEKLVAGDLGVTVKLKYGHSNNTLNSKGIDRKIEPMHFPESRIRKTIFTENAAEMENLFLLYTKFKKKILRCKYCNLPKPKKPS
jgi:elongation factor G